MKLAYLIFSLAIFSITAEATLTKKAVSIKLGDSNIGVNIYENAGSELTFVSLHHNEQTSVGAAKEFITQNGGRLIEIVSVNAAGNPQRNIEFMIGGKTFKIDPNRIFTENGRRCGAMDQFSNEIAAFADEFLQLVLGADQSGKKLLITVHNNSDADAKPEAARGSDLTAVSFVRSIAKTRNFSDQAAGAFLSNTESDADNFIFLTDPAKLGYFAAKGFNVILQKNGDDLRSNACTIDDGSLSVYAAQNGIDYICLESDATGRDRQREMIKAVYEMSRAKD